MIKNIFPIPIYFQQIQFNNIKLSNDLLNLSKHKKDRLKSGVAGSRIDIDQTLIDDRSIDIGNLLGIIQHEIFSYCTTLNIKKQLIIQSWVNINPKYAYNVRHTHSGSKVSGVYYINVPKDCNSKLRLNRSREFTDYQWTTLSLSDNNELKSYFDHTPVTGDLVLFPSYLEHEVTPNYSNSNRISISFNTDNI